LRTLLWLLIGGPVAIVVMALAVVNNQPVTIAFDPFTPQTPFYAVTVPLYVIFFVALMLGIVLGGVGTWTRQGRFRKAARRNRREAARWRVEAERLRGEPAQGPAGATALPAPRRAA
jgi:uncharacterized integral membrane protein